MNGGQIRENELNEKKLWRKNFTLKYRSAYYTELDTPASKITLGL